MLSKDSKIYVAGHRGLVGSAIWNNLRARGYDNLIGRTHSELDLTDQLAVRDFFDRERPDAVVLAAAFVGGIMANSLYRADFIMQNMLIQCNVIGESYRHGVKKLLFLGSTCIYPKNAPQPMTEDCLLTSPLEYTNEEYAIAKIAGLKMCESYNLQYGTNYIAVLPTNLYGPEGIDGQSDRNDILNVLAHYGISDNRVSLWGTGTPLREFLWSEDMADASVHILLNVDFSDIIGIERYSSVHYGAAVDGAVDRDHTTGRGGALPQLGEIRNCHINVGTGRELTIRQLAELVAQTVGFEGDIVFDTTKPDGTMRKLINVDKLHRLGWTHKVEIEEGVRRLFEWYREGVFTF